MTEFLNTPLSNYDFPWSCFMKVLPAVVTPLLRIYHPTREDQVESWRKLSGSGTCNFDSGGDTTIFRRMARMARMGMFSWGRFVVHH